MRNNFYVLAICIIVATFLSGCSTNTTNVGKNNYNINEGNSTLDLSCPGCNVLFLDIELLRADYVGLINPESNATPNIDKFFKNAIIFEDVSSTSGVTGVSNPATLTARDGIFTYLLLYVTYNNTIIPYDTTIKLMPDEYIKTVSQIPTIAQVLHAKKYETININEDITAGEYHLLDRGFDIYWGDDRLQAKDVYTGRAIRLTKEMLEERADSNKKFFLLVRPNDLHSPPYQYPANRSRIEDPYLIYNYISKSDMYEIMYKMENATYTSPQNKQHTNRQIQMDEATLVKYQNLGQKIYTQQLRYVDEELNQIFSYLENSSMLNNTIIVLYSNHGDGVFDNGVPNHGVAYQSCVHVPILIRHPKIKEPIRIKQPISLIDLTPTIYEMVNANAPKDIDGISLIQTITYGTYNRTNTYGLDAESKYIRIADMKLVVWASGEKELYNITADPHEENNIAQQYPETVNKLYKILINHQLEENKKAINIFTEANIKITE